MTVKDDDQKLTNNKEEKTVFPASLTYPANQDIYNRSHKEPDINPEAITESKVSNEKEQANNEKGFDNDVSGNDLDIPGSELDDDQENIGSEDEENNHYSIGGDNHNELDENKGE